MTSCGHSLFAMIFAYDQNLMIFYDRKTLQLMYGLVRRKLETEWKSSDSNPVIVSSTDLAL